MKTVLVSENKGVLTVALNRPDVRNAFSPEMISELTQVFKSAATNKDLRVILLKGEGKAFCAGADLAYMREMAGFTFEKNQADAKELHAMFEAIFSCPVPVVAKVHGSAFGGGLGLIAASDIVVAEEKAQYCFSEVKLGLAPAVISNFVLRKTTLGHAGPWMLTGQVFSTAEALQMGLVHFSFDFSGVESLIENVLQGFRECGPEAIRETKKLIQKVPSLSFEDAKELTSRVIAERRSSAEGQEGLAAFLEKRKPDWRIS